MTREEIRAGGTAFFAAVFCALLLLSLVGSKAPFGVDLGVPIALAIAFAGETIAHRLVRQSGWDGDDGPVVAAAITDLPLAALGMLFSPIVAVAGASFGFLAVAALTRQSALSVLAGTSIRAAQAATLATVLQLATTDGPIGPVHWTLTLGGMAAAALVQTVLFETRPGMGWRGDWPAFRIVTRLWVAIVSGAFVVVLADGMRRDLRLGWLALLVLSAVAVGVRIYALQRLEERRLSFLFGLSNEMPVSDEPAPTLLQRTAEELGATHGDLLLFAGSQLGYRAHLRLVDGVVRPQEHPPVRQHLEVYRRHARDGVDLLRIDGPGDDELGSLLEASGYGSAIVAPLQGTGWSTGLLMLGRCPHASPFRTEDLQLLSTAASHGGGVLRSSELALAVTELRRTQGRLHEETAKDELTGLANRKRFTAALEESLAERPSMRSTLGVAFVDLDDFKAVNDHHGHIVGDKLLAAVAGRLLSTVRVSDLPARLGGDEFAVLLQPLEDLEQARDVCERMLSALEEPVAVGPLVLPVSASIGVCLVDPCESRDPSDVLRRADAAMYAAKDAGKGQVVVFETAKHAATPPRASMREVIRDGLDKGLLHDRYQPIFDLRTDRVVQVEVLARLSGPGGEVLGPDDYRTIIAGSELQERIDLELRHRGSQACARWRRRFPQVGISVNTEPRQLLTDGYVQTLQAALDTAGLPGAAVTLNLSDPRARDWPDGLAERITEIRGLSVQVGLDDIGLGPGSLDVLHTMPVDWLTIPRSFVAHITQRSSSRAIVKSLIDLGDALHIPVVCKGIERPRQLRLLIEMGATLGQGSLLCAPAAISDLYPHLGGPVPDVEARSHR